MRIDRWNSGTLRRYHLPTGAILVVRQDRDARVLPPFNRYVSAPVSRAEAANQLRKTREKADG